MSRPPVTTVWRSSMTRLSVVLRRKTPIPDPESNNTRHFTTGHVVGDRDTPIVREH